MYHAAEIIVQRLAKAGFTPLKEGEKWKLTPGKGYFVLREDSLVAAFRLPTASPRGMTLLASHIDSPGLKLRPHPDLTTHGIGQLGTEIYGAPILHTWLDRDLVAAGRLTLQNAKGHIHSKIVYLDECPMIIPQLALHLDRPNPEKGFQVKPQEHLKPIFSLNAKEKHFEEWLLHRFPDLLSCDLFLVPLEKASFLGIDKELIAASRLDNLTSAYACLYALLHAEPSKETLQMAVFWNHEEIGSRTYVGADSSFIDGLLERISISLKLDREDHYLLKSQSHCLSVDLAHGFHPSYADKYDVGNSASLGKGVVLKFNANQKYATSSAGAAKIVSLAKKQKIPLQKFASRSDIPSGSTVGSIMAAALNIPTVDLGIAGFAMHSIREVISVQDEMKLCHLLKAALVEPMLFLEES